MTTSLFRKQVLCIGFILTLVVCAHAAENTPNYYVPPHGHGDKIETPQGKIYYEREGSGPLVILVAGGPGASHVKFHPWFSRLSKDHTVVYFDNLGCGRSDRLKDPNDYTVELHAEGIEAIRYTLGFERLSLIGHSYGGMPALAYALRYSDRLDRLVLNDTVHSREGWQQNIDSANHFCRNQYPETWEKLMALRARGGKSSDPNYGELFGKAMGDVYWFDLDAKEKLFHSSDPNDGFNYDVYLAMLGDDPEWIVGGSIKRFDPRPALKNVTVPVLVVVGRYDRISTPKIARELYACFPKESSRLVVFEQSGHRPWVEENDTWFTLVEKFLAKGVSAVPLE